MSQHDLDIANQTASSARADINLALKALGSVNSGSTAPATTLANMLWYDTAVNILKMRAEANDAWISVGYLDQSADAFRIFDDTQVVNSGGSQTGLIGDQSTATWQTGTGTTESLVSPAKVKAAILSNASSYTQPTASGAIGTYCFATLGSDVAFGSTISGSSLQTTSATWSQEVGGGVRTSLSLGSALTGTWRCMGTQDALNTSPGQQSLWGATLWLRIS